MYQFSYSPTCSCPSGELPSDGDSTGRFHISAQETLRAQLGEKLGCGLCLVSLNLVWIFK